MKLRRYRLEIMPHRYERERWFWTSRAALMAYKAACNTVDRSGPWSVTLYINGVPYRRSMGG